MNTVSNAWTEDFATAINALWGLSDMTPTEYIAEAKDIAAGHGLSASDTAKLIKAAGG